MKLLQRLKNLFLPEGKISDGFHSFDELYHYRMLYNAAFFNSLEGKYEVHKSYRHSDGEVSWNAVHYYGNIIIDGVSFSPEDSPNTYTMCTETYEAEEKNPLAAGFYRIELVRPVTSEEIEKDGSRWNGYKVGDKTNAFYSPEDVIAIAKEVCKARFLGNWKLKIVDYSGKDLDSEILISEL